MIHCFGCDQGEKRYEGMCWCTCHLGPNEMYMRWPKRLTWQERADRLRRSIEKGSR